MIFENPNLLWLLPALPLLLFGLGFWGWRKKKEAAALFPTISRNLLRKQVEKYIMAGVLIALLVVTLALPKISYTAAAPAEMSGEIILLVDVSGSMAVQQEVGSPTRLDRVKLVLMEIIRSMEELGQVKISLCGFTDIARSHVPLVGKEDYPYLKESIKKVLDIYSTPGGSTSLGQPITNIAGKFSEDAESKTIIMLSDGEPFYWGVARVTDAERETIEEAVSTAVEEDIRVITIGFGEREGAKIPLYDDEGNFTGNYAQKEKGVDFIFSLQEDILKEIAFRTGGEFYYEEDLDGLVELIEENLNIVEAGEIVEEEVYHYVADWFLLASLPVWVIFARRHILG